MWNNLPREYNLGALTYFDSFMRQAHERDTSFLPSLSRSPVLFIASDFTGEQKGSQFNCFSFVITTGNELLLWDNPRRQLRQRYTLSDRRISYSKLRDKRKSAALFPFLSLANGLTGVSISVLVDKRIESLFIQKGRIISANVDVAGITFASWKSAVFERMMRATHLVALFVAGVSVPGQDIIWITDEDEIASNATRLEELCHAFAHILGNMLPHDVGHIRVGTTGTTAGDGLAMEDFAALPDLIGGAVNEVVMGYERAGISLSTTILAPTPSDIPHKTKDIMDSLSDNVAPLKKLAFTIRPVEESTELLYSRLVFHSQPRLVRL